jgi:cytochrome c oxidase accessory protein FixG
MDFDYKESESYRDKIATVDADGKRVWIYPKKPKGKLYTLRTYTSWGLLVLLFGLPILKINGEPWMLFNILERKFILFGIRFLPQDFYLFVLAMLTLLVFIILFTVVFGRIFCGWVCPQTIFMEMVFRKIEYWIEGDANAQRKLNAQVWNSDKIIKKTSKQIIFFIIAFLVANTFLSYIIGIDEVIKIATEPISQHLGGFTAMLLFSGAFYFVFSWLREQVCVAICPYGRLQGVMLDQNSIVVAYDFIRGEPRGKIKKNEPRLDQGDCIDCHLCVHVCPTGIDIRNGTQLECVNCTACIDACDEVMVKVEKPTGLIRYDSHQGIVEKRGKIFTPRVFAYSSVLLILLALNLFFFAGRSEIDTLVLRTPGMLFQENTEGMLSNLYNYQLSNKTNEDFKVGFKLEHEYATIRWVGSPPEMKAGESIKGAFFIDVPKEAIHRRTTKIKIKVLSGDKVIDEVTTQFLGPIK